MKTQEINNKELRNQVKSLSYDDYLQFNYSPSELIDLGWSFDDSIDSYLENNEDNELYDREDAEKQFTNECIVYVRIRIAEDRKIYTTYEISSIEKHVSRISNGVSCSTGDDEKTINDIIQLNYSK